MKINLKRGDKAILDAHTTNQCVVEYLSKDRRNQICLVKYGIDSVWAVDKDRLSEYVAEHFNNETV